MLRKQHKVDDSHYDMPLIYYTEGHSLHFGSPKFALITGLPFGTVNFGLYTFGELKFGNRIFPYKLGLSVINLDVIGVIEDEETFRKLCDDDSIRLCLILALEVILMGRLLTCPVDDTLFRLVENLEDWNCFPWGEHIWTHLYDKIKNVIEKHSDDHYFGMKKDRMYIPTYTSSSFIFAFQVWIFESFERCNCWWIKDPKVILRALGWSKKSIFKRSDCCYLFAKESTTTTDIKPTIVEYDSSCWRSHANVRIQVSEYHLVFARLISLVKKWLKDEVISELDVRVFKLLTIIQVLAHERNEEFGDFVIEDELRLCLKDEEKMRLEQEKNIIEEHGFRVEEAKRMSILGKLTHRKRNHVDIMPGKTNSTDLLRLFHLVDTVWLTPDIERFISKQGQVKCKFPWSDDYTIGQNFWLTLACLDPSRKGWLSEEHIDLWVYCMWHRRPHNANWAMVSCYFVQILMQNSTPFIYANGDKYATPWSDVNQVFFPINETAQHWCLAHLDILSRLVTFYDSGDAYDNE
ncbi:phospholipase-like protein [Tanacetum coccineum]